MLLQMPDFPSFLRLNNIPWYIYTPNLYPFICRWTQATSTSWAFVNDAAVKTGVRVGSQGRVLCLGTNTRRGCRVTQSFYSQCLGDPPDCSPQQLHQFALPGTGNPGAWKPAPGLRELLCHIHSVRAHHTNEQSRLGAGKTAFVSHFEQKHGFTASVFSFSNIY